MAPVLGETPISPTTLVLSEAKVMVVRAWIANDSHTPLSESSTMHSGALIDGVPEGEALGEELGLIDGLLEGESLRRREGIADGGALGE